MELSNFSLGMILTVSAVLQLIAAVLSIRLIKPSGVFLAWVLLACGFVLQAVRRVVSLWFLLSSHVQVDVALSILGLFISIFMLLGVMKFSSLFDNINLTQQALIDKQDQLTKVNKELEAFVYTASHDLKSPLVTIKGFAGMLANDIKAGNEKAIATDLDYINQAVERMGNLLDDLLEFSRVGRAENHATECTFKEVLDAALVMVAGAVANRGVEVELHPAEIQLSGDYSTFLKIWQNLLENAIKYMGGQKAPRIEVGVREQGDPVIFYVRDNGQGIAPQDQQKVFALFEKLDEKSPGTGIGLALVTRVVELYQGRIWVESEGLGQGSCFCFTLPKAVTRRVAV